MGEFYFLLILVLNFDLCAIIATGPFELLLSEGGLHFHEIEIVFKYFPTYLSELKI